MIEEQRPLSVRFKLFGPRVGETIIFGNMHFVNGLMEVPKTDAVNIERALRPYSACLESEWEARQAAWEEAQAEVPKTQMDVAVEGIDQANKIQELTELLATKHEEFEQFKLDTEQQVTDTAIELSEKFEKEKAEAVKVAVEAALAKAAPTPAKEAKTDGASKDNKNPK